MNVKISGENGLVGSTLAKLLKNHPYVNISKEKEDVHFFATPADYSKSFIPLIKNDVLIIDFSDAFREESFKNNDWSYGNILNNNLTQKISMSGCLATSIIFAIKPILENNVANLNVTSIMGQTARGKKEKEIGCRTSHVFKHSHNKEIYDFTKINIPLVPVVGEHNKGILTVAQFQLTTMNDDALFEKYKNYYSEFSFIEVSNKEISTEQIADSINVKISIISNNSSKAITVILDNLYAGSASHGIMMMNKKFNLPLMTGLMKVN